MSRPSIREIMSEEDLNFYFKELDYLRASSLINMFGAPQWLADNHALDRTVARDVFLEWANQFDHENQRL